MKLLLVEFASRHDVEAAARKAAEAGHPAQDALLPSSMEGIEENLAPAPAHPPIGWLMIIAGAIGAITGYAMQWYSAVIDYPIDSGGRPLNSWPAFLLVPYELTILSAGIVGLVGWMALNGLPKLFHPLFDAKLARDAVRNRYVLVFPHSDEAAAWIRSDLTPVSVEELI